MTLVQFLLDRIADDEAPTWQLVPYDCPPNCCAPAGFVGRECLICGDTSFGGTVKSITAIAEEHDVKIHRRARVLAECTAKRAIIRKCTTEDLDDCTECNLAGFLAEDVLRALAAPYAQHEDFQSDWRQL